MVRSWPWSSRLAASFTNLDKQSIDSEAFVCLTDGYMTFNESSKPAYPVVRCISSNVEAPYGEVIHFSKESP